MSAFVRKVLQDEDRTGNVLALVLSAISILCGMGVLLLVLFAH